MKTNQWQSRIGAGLAFVLLFSAIVLTAQAQNPQYPNDRNDQYRRNRQGDDRDRPARHGRSADGYGNFGGSTQLRQTALNAGYNEGIKQGRKDRNKGNRSGYEGQSAYQKATKDYSSHLGDREVYQHYYRAAYENGFNDGVNGY